MTLLPAQRYVAVIKYGGVPITSYFWFFFCTIVFDEICKNLIKTSHVTGITGIPPQSAASSFNIAALMSQFTGTGQRENADITKIKALVCQSENQIFEFADEMAASQTLPE